MKKRTFKPNLLERMSTVVTKAVGTSAAFVIALLVIVIWLLTGPIFDYSDTWQLIINTGTTIVTFLMVFLIQRSQNKEAMALQIKLNELLASSERASNRLIDVEDLSEDELIMIRKYFSELVEMSKKDKNLNTSHTIEEARERHGVKQKKADK